MIPPRNTGINLGRFSFRFPMERFMSERLLTQLQHQGLARQVHCSSDMSTHRSCMVTLVGAKSVKAPLLFHMQTNHSQCNIQSFWCLPSSLCLNLDESLV